MEVLPTADSPRLLIVAPSAYPLGGVATWLDSLIPGLRRSGWELTVGLLAGDHHDTGRYLAQHPFGPVLPIANPGGSREGRQRALVRAMRAADADLVVSVNVADVEAAVDRLRRSGRQSIRLVTTQHGLQQDFYDHLAERRGVVDAVICTNRLSEAMAAEYSGMEPDRVHYAPYGVDGASSMPPAPPARSLRILWAGRFEEMQKRVLDLAPICRELSERRVEFELAIAGAGPEEARLRAELAPWTAAGKVRFLGSLSSEQLAESGFAGRDILLLTSAWETGPIVAWEASVQGLAIVSSRFLGIGREAALVDGRTCLTFPTGDTGAAAAALARLCDPGLRRELREAARSTVRRRYSLEASLAAWDGALRAVSRRPPRPPQARFDTAVASGRLDRALGTTLGETVRTALRVRNRQRLPGDEWPHAYPHDTAPGFLARAEALDRAEEPAGNGRAS